MSLAGLGCAQCLEYLCFSKMPSTTESKSSCLLQTQTEKPVHYTYLKEFRVEQCPLFLQHKCTQHKPFTCFYWHFMNQRRRRPVRKRDGTFNYSPDVYCTKYDETTGICPDGDDCPYLHRTAGDTERRYHLRYYKTGICVYDTDTRGYCVKNGAHCAFAHGIHDLRNPVYDIRELQAMESGGGGISLGEPPSQVEVNTGVSLVGPNSLDKERNALNEDPRWQDTTYVLANYKTEICKRPPRLCRQGYACPQFHNNKDRRRSPKKFKYRSTPCPNVKQGDEWGDPVNCESGDACPYCHTRTEQQFHPEIYKSTKCNDIQQTGYCPRGPFCAFAHVDKEISAARDLNMDNSNDLASILSNALPQSTAGNGINNSTSTISSTTSSIINNANCNNNSSGINIQRSNNQNQLLQQKSSSIASSLPDHYGTFDPNHFGSTQQQQIFNCDQMNSGPGPIARPRSYSTSNSNTNMSSNILPSESLLSNYFKMQASSEDKPLGMNGPVSLRKVSTPSSLFGGTSSPLFSGLSSNTSHLNNSMSLFGAPGYPTTADTVESVVGSALEDLNLDDIHLEASLEKELGPTGGNGGSDSDNNCLLGRSPASSNLLGSAPVNIPGARLGSDGRQTSNIANMSSPPIGASPLSSFTHSAGFGVSPFTRTTSVTGGHGVSSSVASATSSLYDFSAVNNVSPSSVTIPSAGSAASNVVAAAASMLEIQRLREELNMNKAKISTGEERIQHARIACEAWKREVDDANRREKLAEQQRDEAIARVNSLQKEVEQLNGGPYLRSLKRVAELDGLPVNQLKNLQQQLRNDLECLDKVLACRPQHSA